MPLRLCSIDSDDLRRVKCGDEREVNLVLGFTGIDLEHWVAPLDIERLACTQSCSSPSTLLSAADEEVDEFVEPAWVGALTPGHVPSINRETFGVVKLRKLYQRVVPTLQRQCVPGIFDRRFWVIFRGWSCCMDAGISFSRFYTAGGGGNGC